MSLVRMLQTDDRYTGVGLAKAFLALISLFLMSFCAFPSLLVTLPRYVKLSTHSSVSPAIVRGASKAVLIHINFVFDALISSTTSQFAIPFRSFLESELERSPRLRHSQGHLGISLDRKKFSTICLRLILY